MVDRKRLCASLGRSSLLQVPPRFFLPLALFFALVPARASAQSITLNQTTAKRVNADGSNAPARSGINQFQISREDCDLDRGYSIPITLPDVSAFPLLNVEIWAGAVDCKDNNNRTVATTQQCWKAFGGNIDRVTNPGNITLKVRDLLANDRTKQSTYVGPSSIDVCSRNTFTNVTAYFFYSDGANVKGAAAQLEFSVNTVPPAAPAEPAAVDGDGAVSVSWKPISGASTVQGYNVYCEVSSDSEVSPTSATIRPLAADATLGEVDGGVVSDSGTSSGDAAANGDASSSSDAASDRATSSSGGDPTNGCSARILVPGQPPPSGAVLCAQANGPQVSQATIREVNGRALKLGDRVTVAIAARDRFGSVGNLSNLACASSIEVTDFFDAYRGAASSGGAANCSTTGKGNGAASAVIVGLSALCIVLRGRRKHPSQVAAGQKGVGR
jgi:hypothetical protein